MARRSRAAAPLPTSATSLVEAHLPQVRMFARRVTRGLPANIDRNDVEQICAIGLMDAALRFDPARNIRFWTFASRRMLGAVQDHLRDMDPLSRDMRQAVRDGHLVHQEISIEDVAAQAYRRADPRPLQDATADASKVGPLVRTLPRRERLAVVAWMHGRTAASVARRLGLSEARVHQLRMVALGRIRAQLGCST
jgi:RNA polymerase sigma factor for flagellar operon FliA